MSILKPAKPNGSMPIRPTRKPSTPAEPAPKAAGARMGRISSLGVADRLDNDGTKSTLLQITETKEEVKAVTEEDLLIAQFEQRHPELTLRPVTAGTKYVNTEERKASSMPKKMPPVRTAGQAIGGGSQPKRTGGLPALSYVDSKGVERTFEPTQRDGKIFDALAENQRLTMAQIGQLIASIENKPVDSVTASIRRSNITKMIATKTVKKISPNSCSPFYIMTQKGMDYWNAKLPVETALLADSFDDNDVDLIKHGQILAIASAVLRMEAGEMRIKMVDPRSGSEYSTQAPTLPILTQHRINAAGRTMGQGKKIVQLQRDAIKAWLNIVPSKGGMLQVPNNSWQLNDTTPAISEAILKSMKSNFVVKQVGYAGAETLVKTTPAWLFYYYNDSATPESLVHFAIGQPNIMVKDTGGRMNAWNGCQAGRVETILQSKEFYKYILFRVYSSHLKLTRFLAVTPHSEIELAISESWRELMDERMVDPNHSDWLAFGEYTPINSTASELKHFSAPVSNQPTRIYSQG